jgi:hypothetical protein
MKANYYHDEYSWFRLAVHRCDKERRALKGKSCATEDQIDKFFETNLFSMLV